MAVALAPQPLIAVKDVPASSRWYGQLLGATGLAHHPHREIYNSLSSGDETVLQLHAWDAENHPNLTNRAAAPPGHGVLLWFAVEDFEAAAARAHGLGAEVIEDVHVNPSSGLSEMWLRDPDGYVVVIASRWDGGTEG